MPRRSMARRMAGDAPVVYTYTVYLSCEHFRLRRKPLPAIGDVILCCTDNDVVTGVDETELAVWCPDCNRYIGQPYHRLATLTANTAASVHNVREKRGHRATVHTVGMRLGSCP